ncbi:MAG: hypothetical protein V1779_17630 [bacterium]
MSKIRFEDGTVVNFDGTPTQKDIEEVAQKLKVQKKQIVIPTKQKEGLLGKVANIADKTIGKAANFMFGKTAETVGSVIGAGAESAKELITNKPTKRIFTNKADALLGTPGQAAKNIALTALELTPTGLGSKTTAKLALKAKKPITLIAEKLYQSALKPKNITKAGKIITKAEDITKIGLNERIWLTRGGVEKVATKIDDFENLLGEAIEQAQKSKKVIKIENLKPFVDEAKKFFKDQVNISEAKRAMKEIDNIYKAFAKKYGKGITIQTAQEIKVKTGQALRKYYNTMSSARIEGEKQMVRGLKEEIVKKAPIVKNINERLSNLYKFDNALQKAQTRFSNYNLMGIASKVGAGVGGTKGFAVTKLLEILDAPAIKSGAAISLDVLSKGAEKVAEKGRIPVSLLIANLAKYLEEE